MDTEYVERSAAWNVVIVFRKIFDVHAGIIEDIGGGASKVCMFVSHAAITLGGISLTTGGRCLTFLLFGSPTTPHTYTAPFKNHKLNVGGLFSSTATARQHVDCVRVHLGSVRTAMQEKARSKETPFIIKPRH